MLLATCCQWDDPPSSLTRGMRTLLQLQEGFLVLGTIEIFPLKWPLLIIDGATRWAPTSYKWSYNNLYKWPDKWVTGVITLLMGVITPFITDRGPPGMIAL